MHVRSRRFATLILACVPALASAIMSSWSAGGAQSLPAASQPAAGVDVSVDPRIELLLIVQHLTGDYEQRTRLITDFDFAYKREIEEHFRPFAMHTVVSTYRALALQGFSFDAGPQAMLRLTSDEHLTLRAAMPDELLSRVGGAARFEEFRAQIADFAQASGFFQFFARHKPMYDELCEAVRTGAKPDELVAALNDYAGMPVTHAHLILFPLGHPGGFAAEMRGDDGVSEVFAVVGPGGAVDDKPVFGGPTAPWFESLVIHEFAHTIVNPLAAQHAERVAKTTGLLQPIRQQMSKQAYQSWETVVNEHIVRAIEARIALKRHGMAAGSTKMSEDVKRGFRYLPALVQALARYEADRVRWPTLADFYPELLAVFDAADSAGKPQPPASQSSSP